MSRTSNTPSIPCDPASFPEYARKELLDRERLPIRVWAAGWRASHFGLRVGAAVAFGLMGMAHAIAEREREKAIEQRKRWGLTPVELVDREELLRRYPLPESTEDE